MRKQRRSSDFTPATCNSDYRGPVKSSQHVCSRPFGTFGLPAVLKCASRDKRSGADVIGVQQWHVVMGTMRPPPLFTFQTTGIMIKVAFPGLLH